MEIPLDIAFTDKTNTIAKKLIEHNSSLRVQLPWSFESIYMMQTIMDECLHELVPRYNVGVNSNIVSDFRGDWFGFIPHNVFEREIYDKLDILSLAIFNNEICDFQQDVVDFVLNHKIYKQHAILKDLNYRYKYFRAIRHDRDRLSEAFEYCIDCNHQVTGINAFPRQLLEESIGCHYLYHPDVFFELLEFYTLKGLIYE